MRYPIATETDAVTREATRLIQYAERVLEITSGEITSHVMAGTLEAAAINLAQSCRSCERSCAALGEKIADHRAAESRDHSRKSSFSRKGGIAFSTFYAKQHRGAIGG